MSVPGAGGIDVVVVNHNACEHLSRCLFSVFQQAPGQVIVADSGSVDGSCELVRSAFPCARLLADGVNRGFGASANRAVSQCAERYVLILNSDTVVLPGALGALARYLDDHPKAAVVGPQLTYTDGSLQRSCYPFPGTLRWVIDNDDLAPLTRRISWLRNGLFRTWPHDRPRRVPWVKGAAMAVRREVFASVGGFDESYFLYAEDIDHCWRVAKAGWEVHFAPVAVVVHVSEASTSKWRVKMTAMLYGSIMKFCRARYSTPRVVAIGILLRIAFLSRILRHALRLRHAADPLERTILQEQMQGWRQILLRL